jgi:hypothetical protein
MPRIPGVGRGVTYVASEGLFVVLGTRSNQEPVFRRDGSRLWTSEIIPNMPGYLNDGCYTPGANTVLALWDGKCLIVRFDDAVIRMFVLSLLWTSPES